MSKRVYAPCFGPSLTRQEFKDECDLGKTIARFAGTTEGRDALKRARGTLGGSFEDVSSVVDLKTALDASKRAREIFDKFPAKLRERFGNDPNEFIKFVDNPANVNEMVRMGLLKQKVPVVAPPKEEKPPVK